MPDFASLRRSIRVRDASLGPRGPKPQLIRQVHKLRGKVRTVLALSPAVSPLFNMNADTTLAWIDKDATCCGLIGLARGEDMSVCPLSLSGASKCLIAPHSKNWVEGMIASGLCVITGRGGKRRMFASSFILHAGHLPHSAMDIWTGAVQHLKNLVATPATWRLVIEHMPNKGWILGKTLPVKTDRDDKDEKGMDECQDEEGGGS
jgi:hypothetical protein